MADHLEKVIERITWLTQAKRVRFSISPTLDMADGKPFCRWHDDRDIIQAWAKANLTGRFEVSLGREDAPYFTCESIEFVITCEGEDETRARSHWCGA